MIKKIRRKRIVVRKKELIVVRNRRAERQICPVCRAEFAVPALAADEKSELLPPSPAKDSDAHEC